MNKKNSSQQRFGVVGLLQLTGKKKNYNNITIGKWSNNNRDICRIGFGVCGESRDELVIIKILSACTTKKTKRSNLYIIYHIGLAPSGLVSISVIYVLQGGFWPETAHSRSETSLLLKCFSRPFCKIYNIIIMLPLLLLLYRHCFETLYRGRVRARPLLGRIVCNFGLGGTSGSFETTSNDYIQLYNIVMTIIIIIHFDPVSESNPASLQ